MNNNICIWRHDLKRFNKVMVAVITLELVIILVGNYYCISSYDTRDDKYYLVEVKRLIHDIETGKAPAVKSVHPTDSEFNIDPATYPHIVSVREYDPDDKDSSNYVVKKMMDKLYRFDYITDISYKPIIYMNIVFGFSILITIFIFIYIKRSVIRPFYSMERLANDLAGGNLSKPVKEERSRIFGKFLWSIDMLREKLEQSREKEMAYMKERKTLMLSLSHDIKTPLSAIELYTKALSTGLYDTDEKKNEAYLGIENNLNDLKNYIDEITAASKDDFMLLEVKDDEIYLSSVLKPIKDYYLEKFEHLHTIFEIAPTNDILVKGDRDRLVEVMQNILENAIKYGDGRCVDISFSEEEDAKLVHIHNTGMPPEENDMVHLFDSFYRGSNSEKKKGSGLGLYISRQLMKRMDGDIYATATKDGFEAVVVIMKA